MMVIVPVVALICTGLAAGHFPWSPSRSLASRADTQSFELHPAAADD